MSTKPEVYELIRSIPAGRVAAYGEVGRVLEPPLGGFFVGRLLRKCPEDVPWWRVVAKDGRLPVWKIDPELENIQIRTLLEEGVEITDGVVNMDLHEHTF